MFNGLIRHTGIIKSFSNNNLTLISNLKPNIGDSVATNGICLSVTKINNDGFNLNLSTETQNIVKPFKIGAKVHTELAMKVGDRIDGHILSGHIDGLGKIKKIEKLNSGIDFYISLDEKLMPFVCKKGSIAIDGVSLTINDVINDGVRLTIIDITLKDTLFNSYKIGDLVNVETDILARYAERILNYKKQNQLSWSDVDRINLLY
ncbi:riboflavin synthase [Campylobacter sp. MG1]|uniref:riboflavin synthase n=1 Tax=Campylobacter sp. MG1 TaxID=2976332 RepID=UPI00226D3136|nr:riboflavin synthase [Campylobacter sp. MG1]